MVVLRRMVWILLFAPTMVSPWMQKVLPWVVVVSAGLVLAFVASVPH